MSGDWTAADPHSGTRKLQGSASVNSCHCGSSRRALLLPGACDWSDRPNLHSSVQTVSVLCPIVGRQHTNSAAAASSTASLAQEGTSQRHAHPLRHLTEWGGGRGSHPSSLQLLHEAHRSIFNRIHTCSQLFFLKVFLDYYYFLPSCYSRVHECLFLEIHIYAGKIPFLFYTRSNYYLFIFIFLSIHLRPCSIIESPGNCRICRHCSEVCILSPLF